MVSLVHHWAVRMRGGEKVLEQFCLLFPDAPIYALVADAGNLSPILREKEFRTSFLQNLPTATRNYQRMLPIFPLAISNLRISKETSLVFSTDAAVIKGVSVPEGVPHVCYCHSPPRYLWDMLDTYASQSKGLNKLFIGVFKACAPYVREFDFKAAQRVDHFIANSGFVRDRIKTCYGKDATVIYPPVNIHGYSPDRPSEDFYLIISELTPYKRVNLAVDAFRGLKSRLVVIGDGPQRKALEADAPSNVTFLGRQPQESVKDHYERCRGFIYPQVEDFGITAVEAQAAGKPVIALRAGGALETVVEGKTGVFFDEQSSSALADAIRRFEGLGVTDWSKACRANAERFSEERFRKEISEFLLNAYPDILSKELRTAV